MLWIALLLLFADDVLLHNFLRANPFKPAVTTAAYVFSHPVLLIQLLSCAFRLSLFHTLWGFRSTAPISAKLLNCDCFSVLLR